MPGSNPPIVIATVTFYTDADELRRQLALELVRGCTEAKLPIVIADDSPSPTVAADFEREGATVVKQGGSKHGGGKGGGIRAALDYAVNAFGSDGAVLYTEPEKVGLVPFARQICARLLDKSADVVVPRRTHEAFSRSYPAEQFHSESFAAIYLDTAAREAGLNLPTGLDWFFGPFATQRSLIGHWLAFPASDWTAQMVPFVKLAATGSNLVIADVAYEHPRKQKEEEEGRAKWLSKRLTQLNAILPTLEKIFTDLSADLKVDARDASDGDVVYKDVLAAFVDAAISELSDTKPDDPYRKMYEFLFQASLVDYTTLPTTEKSKWDDDFIAKFGLVFHEDAVVASKGKGKGPKSGVKFMLADAGDFFSELSKKMKATGAPLTGMMTAEQLKAADAAAAKMKREKEAKEQAARDAHDAENAIKTAEMEASGKKVSGGLHKFDASEVDIHGGSGTADDFMDAFGF